MESLLPGSAKETQFMFYISYLLCALYGFLLPRRAPWLLVGLLTTPILGSMVYWIAQLILNPSELGFLGFAVRFFQGLPPANWILLWLAVGPSSAVVFLCGVAAREVQSKRSKSTIDLKVSDSGDEQSELARK
jgi:hypothetical protein